MKLPLSLIKSFLQIDLPVTQIGETLTLLGIEVDGIINEHPPFAKVVVGEIVSVKPHDKLQIAQISDGKEKFQVICGAPNCRPGIHVPFAKVGAVLTDSEGRVRTIEKATIRGIESEGMLCSALELRIGEDHVGLLELPPEMKPGQDLTPLLWDPILELSLTPNLGHCMSALGVARELSAGLKKPLRISPVTLQEKGGPIAFQVTVEDFHLCPRYMCRAIEGVKVGPSPFLLKKELEGCGIRSINNIVDAANYVMMKTGQPFHVFDSDRLKGKAIRVAVAKKAEKFLGLDGIEREVPAGTLLIWDSNHPVAIAGILGGEESAVNEKTTSILIEAAQFDPISIRKSGKKLGLRSESSQRFEKGIDPLGIEQALNELCLLIGGHVAKGIIDVKKHPFTPKTIVCRTARVNQILGTKLSATEIEEIFHRLGFKTAGEKVEIPSYRQDITEEIDLVEEVARIYGYNNIEKKPSLCTISTIPNDPAYVFEQELRNRLSGLHLQEFLTCDLISPRLAQLAPSEMKTLKAVHSKSEDYSILRTSLLPGLLQVVKRNVDQKNLSILGFELGRIHFLNKDVPQEIPMGAIILTGKTSAPHWDQKPKDVDFFDLKGLIENLLEGLGIRGSFKPSHHSSLHPGRQCDIHLNDLVIGSLGEIHPALLQMFDIGQKTYYAEFNVDHLMRHRKTQVKLVPLAQFPASERDWTVALSPSTLIESVFKEIYASATPLLEKVELIDLYVPENGAQKNATFRFLYRDRAKTVSFEEVEAEHAKVLQKVTKSL